MQYHAINFSESALAPPDKLLASLAESWPGLKAFSAVNERSGLEQLPGNYPLCFQIAYLTSQMQEMSSVYQCVCVCEFVTTVTIVITVTKPASISGRDWATHWTWVFPWHFSSEHLSFRDQVGQLATSYLLAFVCIAFKWGCSVSHSWHRNPLGCKDL